VHIVLRQHGEILTLQDCDKGQGLCLGLVEQKKAFSLLGMRQRVIALGGEMKFISPPGHGTILELSISVDIPDRRPVQADCRHSTS
jgi:glucose-6-phosphate-specific signal transduction histidine kinase